VSKYKLKQTTKIWQTTKQKCCVFHIIKFNKKKPAFGRLRRPKAGFFSDYACACACAYACDTKVTPTIPRSDLRVTPKFVAVDLARLASTWLDLDLALPGSIWLSSTLLDLARLGLAWTWLDLALPGIGSTWLSSALLDMARPGLGSTCSAWLGSTVLGLD
jgi:hypothetical protein